jgi:hypothetical protein
MEGIAADGGFDDAEGSRPLCVVVMCFAAPTRLQAARSVYREGKFLRVYHNKHSFEELF